MGTRSLSANLPGKQGLGCPNQSQNEQKPREAAPHLTEEGLSKKAVCTTVERAAPGKAGFTSLTYHFPALKEERIRYAHNGRLWVGETDAPILQAEKPRPELAAELGLLPPAQDSALHPAPPGLLQQRVTCESDSQVGPTLPAIPRRRRVGGPGRKGSSNHCLQLRRSFPVSRGREHTLRARRRQHLQVANASRFQGRTRRNFLTVLGPERGRRWAAPHRLGRAGKVITTWSQGSLEQSPEPSRATARTTGGRPPASLGQTHRCLTPPSISHAFEKYPFMMAQRIRQPPNCLGAKMGSQASCSCAGSKLGGLTQQETGPRDGELHSQPRCWQEPRVQLDESPSSTRSKPTILRNPVPD
nr:PREDICTED: uncharacterized protein LOC103556093 [Equus przewalskii]